MASEDTHTSAAIVLDFIRRVQTFLGKTAVMELLPQNTNNACAAVCVVLRASEPSHGTNHGPVYHVAFRNIMAQSSTSGTGTCSLGGSVQHVFFIQTK